MKVCNTDMQYRYLIKIRNTEMQYRYAMQICNKDMQNICNTNHRIEAVRGSDATVCCWYAAAMLLVCCCYAAAMLLVCC